MAALGLLMFAFASRTRAHSWMRCSDYHAEITGQDYNETYCSGWMRGEDFTNISIGTELIIGGPSHQVRIGGGGPLCQHTFNGSTSTTYKMAQYKSRQSVRVVWPAKRHANYECQSNIPDTAMKLYMNPNVNPTEDLPNKNPTLSTQSASNDVLMADQGYILVKDWQDGCTPGSDGCGFQNCPKFCENTNSAPCFGDFVVPDVDTEGYYTFVWYEEFMPTLGNPSPYISCYEAYVTPRDTTAEPTVIPSEDPTIIPTFMPSQSPTMEPIFVVDNGDDATMIMANVFLYTLNFVFVFVCML